MDIGELPNPFKSNNGSRDIGDNNNSALYGIGDYDEEPAPQPQQEQPKPAAAAAQATEKVKEEVNEAAEKVTGK